MSTRYIEVTPHLRLTAAEAELVGSEAIDALRHEYGECVTWRGRTRKNGVAHPLLPEVLSYVGRYIAKVVHAAATHVTIHIGHEANLIQEAFTRTVFEHPVVGGVVEFEGCRVRGFKGLRV